MQGTIVQLTNLKTNTHLNGIRGKVIRLGKKYKTLCVKIHDDTIIKVSTNNCFKVYCVGLPKEYRSYHDSNSVISWQHFFLLALQSIDSSKFYVVPLEDDEKHAVLIINVQFFHIITEKMNTPEPYVRFYTTTHSQNDSNILFGQKCIDNPSDGYPWFYDMSHDMFTNLVYRFCSIELDNDSVTENEYKKANIKDFESIFT